MKRRNTGIRIGLIPAAMIVLVLIILILGMQITEVTVIGNERYTEQQIVDLLFPDQRDLNTAYFYYNEKTKPHKTIPFVEEYKIVFVNMNHVEVILYEKSVVGYVTYMSSNLYFDKDGIVVESTNTILPGIPLITGLEFGKIVLYQPLPAGSGKIFDDILNMTQILSIYKIHVDRIQYNSYVEATLYIDDLKIIMGDNEGLNGKIAELNDILPRLSGRAGTLYLDTYNETDTNVMYTFEPQ